MKLYFMECILIYNYSGMSWKTAILGLENDIILSNDVNEMFTGRIILNDKRKNGELKSYLHKTGKSESYLNKIRLYGKKSSHMCTCRECNRPRNYMRNGKTKRYININSIGNG